MKAGTAKHVPTELDTEGDPHPVKDGRVRARDSQQQQRFTHHILARLLAEDFAAAGARGGSLIYFLFRELEKN